MQRFPNGYGAWNFSESSLPLLERCLKASAAIEVDPENVFVKQFSKLFKIESDHENNSYNESDSDDEGEKSKARSPSQEMTEEPEDEIIQEILENNVHTRFDFIVENCCCNPKLYSKLAKGLPITTIEWFCDNVFKKENLPTDFLVNFYKIFLIELLKREHSMSSMDVLLNGKKFHRPYFNTFLELFINDIDLPNSLLLQYVTIIDEASKLETMKFIMECNIADNAFSHHVLSIDLMYKYCEKTEKLQDYMLLKLSNVSQQCSENINYGRLLLNVLRNQKKFTTDFDFVQNIVDQHNSMFQRVCTTQLNTLKELHDKQLNTEVNKSID